jgi:hypothetical protein
MNATFTANEIAATIESMSNGAFAARKVTADDIATTEAKDVVSAVAHDIVTNYAGTFPYMLNMRQYVALGLTDAQIAGVLNCAIADYRYAQRNAAVKQAEAIVAQPTRTYDHSHQYVADGWYTIVGPQGGHRTLRLQTVEPTEKYPKQDGVKQWLSYLCGADNVGDYKTIGFLHGNEVILTAAGKFQDIVAAARFLVKNATNIGEYGRQYALRSGKCYVCNRKLTTPESIANGIGPKCAAK